MSFGPRSRERWARQRRRDQYRTLIRFKRVAPRAFSFCGMRAELVLASFTALLIGGGDRRAANSAERAAHRSTAVESRIDSAVRATLLERNIPGAAVAVLRRDSVILLRGYGVADLRTGRPVTAQTIFQIASLTKPFAAMAVLMLAEEGKVSLDSPATRYVKWIPERYARVTVRQLLNHTSGVAPDMRRANVDEFPMDEFRRRFTERPASFPAGTGWQYANAGYALLSEIVEHVTGEAFGDHLERRIFAPAGMSQTAYRAPRTGAASHAVGYDLVDGSLQEAPHVFSGWGNSGIESTASDLARWGAMLHRGDLLSRDSYREMFAPGRIADTAVNFAFRGGRASYGLGWFLVTDAGERVVTHGGAIAGFSSVLSRVPGRDWTVIVLSNAKQGADRQNQAEVIAASILNVLRSEAAQ